MGSFSPISGCLVVLVVFVYTCSGTQVVDNVYDPKFHDDGRDSLAVETAHSQDYTQDAPTIVQKNAEPHGIFETGSTQEYHDVVTKTEDVQSPIKDIYNPVEKLEDDISHQPKPTEASSYLPESSTLSEVTDSLSSKTPEGRKWKPNEKTFFKDTAQEGSNDQYSSIKWPTEDGAHKDDYITPQTYDFIEPVLIPGRPHLPHPHRPRPFSFKNFEAMAPSPVEPKPVPHFQYQAVFRYPSLPVVYQQLGSYLNTLGSYVRAIPKAIQDTAQHSHSLSNYNPTYAPRPYGNRQFEHVDQPQQTQHYSIQDILKDKIQPLSSAAYSKFSNIANGISSLYKFRPSPGYTAGPPPPTSSSLDFDYGGNPDLPYSEDFGGWSRTPEVEEDAWFDQGKSKPFTGRPKLPNYLPRIRPTADQISSNLNDWDSVENYEHNDPLQPQHQFTSGRGSLSSLYNSDNSAEWIGNDGESSSSSGYEIHDKDMKGYYGKPLKSYYTTPEKYYDLLNEPTDGTSTNRKPSYASSGVHYDFGDSFYEGYTPSHRMKAHFTKYPASMISKVPYGAWKEPGSVSDEFLYDVQNSYGTPYDLKVPTTSGYYRTKAGSWARVPYMKATKGYKYKYSTLSQIPDPYWDPLYKDFPEGSGGYDGLMDQASIHGLDADCENNRHCKDYKDAHGISEYVDITKKPKGIFRNGMLKNLMKSVGKRRRRPLRKLRLKHKRGCRSRRCRKY